jgi:hypothetical protein
MFKEIRQQPENIRELFMWLSVFIVFSLIGIVWARSFQEKMIVLLNPQLAEPEGQQSYAKVLAPFAVVRNSIRDFTSSVASLGSLVGLPTSDQRMSIESAFKESQKVDNPKLLPLAGNKQ